MTGVRWTQDDYRDYLERLGAAGKRVLAGDGGVAVRAADAKPARRAAAAPAYGAEKVHPRYRVHIHHRSQRLADATGRSHKAAVDGIVLGGILPDDSPKCLAGISESYEKAECNETVIEVYEIMEPTDEPR